MVSSKRRQVAVAAGVIALVVAVVMESWAGRPLSLSSFLALTIVGVAIGSIYAVAASGLVLTYTTSGIFNFAHGAIGMFMAFLYWELRVNRHLPAPVALVAVVGVAAPLMGAAIERVVVRRLHGVPLVNQLVVTVGLMLTLMGVAGTIWKPAGRNIEPFFGQGGFHAPGGVFVTWHRAITVAVALAVAVVLRLLLYRTRTGIAMRAVVDDPELAALHGARPARSSMTAWALGSAMAAIAGILLAPEVGLVVGQLTLLVIDAFAAAVLGRLRNLPLTYVGGLAIGLLSSYALGYLDLAGRWNNARHAVPSVFLFAVLLVLPDARVQLGRIMRVRSPRVPTGRQAVLRALALVAIVAAVSPMLSTVNVNRLTLAIVTGLVMLSLVPLTGWSGQVSLAQMAFVGVGAFAMSKVGGGSPLGILFAVALAVPFGVLVSLPSLRLHGLYLALSTMAFALIMELLFFPQPEVFAGTRGGNAVRIERLRLAGVRLESPRAFLMVVTVAFALVGMGLMALRRGPLGRRLIAMRDSPAACATTGVNLLATKVAVFALSAALAGLAGALFGMYRVVVTASDFTMLQSLPVLLLAVVGGISTVGGALLGGLLTVAFAVLKDVFHWSVFTTLEILGPGLAAVGLGRNPTGTVPDVAEEVRERVHRPRPADVGELGLTRPFTPDDVALLDAFLGLESATSATFVRGERAGGGPA